MTPTPFPVVRVVALMVAVLASLGACRSAGRDQLVSFSNPCPVSLEIQTFGGNPLAGPVTSFQVPAQGSARVRGPFGSVVVEPCASVPREIHVDPGDQRMYVDAHDRSSSWVNLPMEVCPAPR